MLQNRYEMATYFWAMVSNHLSPQLLWTPQEADWGRLGQWGHLLKPCLSIFQGREGVAAALAACKIIKEMSHLEKEAEVARTMREAKYEQLALGESQAEGLCLWSPADISDSHVAQGSPHGLLCRAKHKAFPPGDGNWSGSPEQEVEALTILRGRGRGRAREGQRLGRALRSVGLSVAL